MGDPEHIAATVLYLVSPAGAYVTGKILEVDGGSQLPPPAFDRRTCTPYGSMDQPNPPRARHSRRSGMPGGPRCPAPGA
ncbi:SDR family oxidoreductase [Streptomyces sp. NPDC002787]